MIQKQIQRIRCKAREIIAYRRSLRAMRRCQQMQRMPGPIRVVFLTQYIPSWNKVERIYDTLKNRADAEASIVCVPSDPKSSDLQNDTYDYFVSHGYDAINARQQDGTWFDLHQLHPDAVFHSRPYNAFMPAPYTSSELAKYTNVYQVLYGVCMTYGGIKAVMNFDFFKDVACFYAENEDGKEFFDRRYKIGVRQGLQTAQVLGSPVLEYMIQTQADAKDYYPALRSSFRMMWTPRWSTDPVIGGSNFFRYRDLLMDYAAANPDVSLLLRPHPLMLNNFIKTGEMTESEVQAFRDRCANASNMALDERKDYTDQFWCADVLITDASAVVFEFFVTGKPIIYCNSEIDFHYLPQIQEMLTGCYLADNAEDVEKYIHMLRSGSDPMRDTRQQLMARLYGSSLSGCSARICEDLIRRLNSETEGSPNA